jgi:hypothetical protein
MITQLLGKFLILIFSHRDTNLLESKTTTQFKSELFFQFGNTSKISSNTHKDLHVKIGVLSEGKLILTFSE